MARYETCVDKILDNDQNGGTSSWIFGLFNNTECYDNVCVLFKYPDLNSDPYFFAYDSIESDKMCPEVARYLHTVHYSDQCFYKHQCEHLNCFSDCQAFITWLQTKIWY